MTIDSKMAFNECTFGFVPHSGATYYLSRLPNDFGTFMALTGLPIHGTDAAKLKLVDTVMATTKELDEWLSDVVYSFGYEPREGHEIWAAHENRYTHENNDDTARVTGIEARHMQNRQLDLHEQQKAGFLSMRDREQRLRGFEEAHERVPSSVADAEAQYNMLLR